MELVGSSEGESGVAILLRRVMIFTVVAEVVTFLLLLPWFIDLSGGGRGLWQAFFHAISAFNNAGFDLMANSLALRARSAIRTRSWSWASLLCSAASPS